MVDLKIRIKNFIINHRKQGFTLVEILVTMGVLSVLSGFLIIYSHTSEIQLILFREQAKIVNLIQRAKYLSVSTYVNPGQITTPCGYGVHFEYPRTMVLFKDVASDCTKADRIYNDPSGGQSDCSNIQECVEKINLSSGVVFAGMSSGDIDFVPPDPTVIITPPQNQVIIGIFSVIDPSVFKNVKINNAGQITVQ